jgi:hypothetical protein
MEKVHIDNNHLSVPSSFSSLTTITNGIIDEAEGIWCADIKQSFLE